VLNLHLLAVARVRLGLHLQDALELQLLQLRLLR
jgi:hypothetical protein